MNRIEIIKALNYNIALEHSAIIQYLLQAFAVSDPEVRSELEEIAREEMRHLKMFAQKVRSLGGIVRIGRVEEEILREFGDFRDAMNSNIRSETIAIETYTKQHELIKDDSVRRLLERVIKDEEEHRSTFGSLYERRACFKSGSEDDEGGSPLESLFQEEYRTILDYLHLHFNSKDRDVGDTALDIAIDSMVHMGKLGELLTEKTGSPFPEMSETSENKGLEDRLKEEKETFSAYKKAFESLESEEEKELLRWIMNHEKHHISSVEDLLRKSPRFSVGRLRKKGGR